MSRTDKAAREALPRRRRAGVAMVLVLALIAGLSYSIPQAAAAPNTIYVAPNGSDSNPGTRARPKATIVGAMQALPSGGDILMRGGTYRIANRSGALWRGGTANRPLVVKSAPGERANLISARDNHCVLALGDYTQIRNLTCSGYNGIMAYGAKHVKIVGNRVHDITASRTQGINVSGGVSDVLVRRNTVERVPHSGIAVGDLRAGSSRNIRIIKNVVREANRDYRNPSRLGGWGSGISVVGSVNVRIRGNDVRSSYGEGINCPLTDRCIVRRNTVVDAYNALFYADNSSNSIWEDNVARSSGDSRFHLDYGWGPTKASGFVFGNETGWYDGSPNPVSGNIVRNNLVIDAHRGVGFLDYSSGRGMKNTRIANNTFVRVACGTDFSLSGGTTGNEFVNNIVVPARGGRATCTSTNGVSYSNNLWSGLQAGSAAHRSDRRGNPGFVGGPGTSPASYALAPGSKAIDAGRSLGYVTDDRRGRKRPQRASHDIGAFEY